MHWLQQGQATTISCYKSSQTAGKAIHYESHQSIKSMHIVVNDVHVIVHIHQGVRVTLTPCIHVGSYII